MIRKIVHIDEEKCNGCGACAEACHEGAIAMINGKARLIRDDYCDGLGDCLPSCPTGAIEIREREAKAYDEKAVAARKTAFTCPSSMAKTIERKESSYASGEESALTNWPVQIKLAPFSAPYYDNAELLIAADCTAFAYGSFHADLIRNKVTLIGCPKLDGINYAEKLEAIIRENDIRGITVARMEVPCCGGLEIALKKAVEASGKNIEVNVVTISTSGEILR